MSLSAVWRPRKRQSTPEPTPEPSPTETEAPVTQQNPQQIAAQQLDAAQAELENSEAHAAHLKQRHLDGDESVSPADIDAAETRIRHAALALEAAKAAHSRAHEQVRRDGWPAIRDQYLAGIADNPAGDLRDALDKLAPEAKAALETLGAALSAATAPAERHNASVAALGQYITIGGYTDPEDKAVAWFKPEYPYQSSVSAGGKGGQQVDYPTIVDLWLGEQLPVEQIEAWLERLRIAKARQYPY